MTDDTSKGSEEQEEVSLLQQYSEEFDALCQIRGDEGAEEYGPTAFLKAPLVRMAAEELADLSNYARFMYIKLRLLEEKLHASGIDLSAGVAEEIWGEDQVSFGPASFVSAEEIQGFLSKKKRGG